MLIRRKTIAFLAIIASFLMAANHSFGQSTPVAEQLIHQPASSYQAAERALQTNLGRKDNRHRASGIILFVGDGMSIATVTAGRIYVGQKSGANGEEHNLSFERFPAVGLAKTYNTNQQTPDSAGTMTALITGEKTKAGVLSMAATVARADTNTCGKQQLTTLFELAEDRNWATGIVTTTSVTHATPAAGFAHSPERNWENDSDLPSEAKTNGCRDIARQFVEFSHGDGIDVLLGGGRSHFLPKDSTHAIGKREDGVDLISQWQQRNPNGRYFHNRRQLIAHQDEDTDKILGLFSDSHMDFEADRDSSDQPSLSEMVNVAINQLQKNKRFLLVVEAGRIDHAHHVGNAYRALEDLHAFDQAIELAHDKVNLKKTLMIVTADHSHTLTLAGYPTRGNPILGFVTGNDKAGEAENSPSLAADKKPYTTLSYANGPGYYNQPSDPDNPYARFNNIGQSTRQTTLEDNPEAEHYHQEAGVPLATETHAGDDVAVYAQGPWAHLLNGVVEQHYIFHVMKYAGEL